MNRKLKRVAKWAVLILVSAAVTVGAIYVFAALVGL